MKQAISIEIDVKDIKDGILINENGTWKAVSKKDLFDPMQKQIDDLKDEMKNLIQSNQAVLKEINDKVANIESDYNRIKKALIDYGFKLFEEGNKWLTKYY